MIDFGDLDLVRAEAATLLDVFADVRLVARPGPRGRQPRADRLGAAAPRRGRVRARAARGRSTAPRSARFAGDAAVLTDDDAPADQLLTAGT